MLWMILTGFVVWFIFGFFAVRLSAYNYSLDPNCSTRIKPGETVLLFACGALTWLFAMVGVDNGLRIRRTSHFVPRIPNALKPESPYKVIHRLFLVKENS